MAKVEELIELEGKVEWAAAGGSGISFIDIAPDIVSAIDSLPVEVGL